MTAQDWRAVAIIPLLIVCAGFVGYGMVVPAFLSGVAAGWCLGAS